MSIAKRLFETAVEDLRAVEVLYVSQHYNLALFQLQQSVEKFVKSFGIYTNAIKPEDMGKTINHLPHKVFTKLYENQIDELSKKNRRPMFVADLIPPHLRENNLTDEKLDNLKGLYSEVKKAESHRHETLLLEELQQFLNGAEMLEKKPSFDEDKLLEDFKIDFVKTNEHFIEYFKGDENVKTISEELIENSHAVAQNKLEKYKLDKIRSSKFNYISYCWINLSIMTSTHQQSTRYPSIINEDTPNTLYDENNVIIQNMPELIKIMKKTIKKFKEVYPNT